MSDNMKETQEEQQINESAPAEKKRLGKKDILIIVCAAVALVATVAGIIIGIALGKKDNTPEPSATFNLLTDDLSEYIEIDAKYYKNYTVELNYKSVSTDYDHADIDVVIGNEINKILYNHKYGDSEGKAIVDDGIISVGDTVNIFYKGYYYNGEEKVYFNGGSNIGDGAEAYSLGIGSGSHHTLGFEYNMIGKNPNDYSEDNPLVIEVYFPKNYHLSAELKGKVAYFEVTFESLEEYYVPEFNDTFVTDKLSITADDLSTYKGNTLTEKYRAYVRDEYYRQYGYDVDGIKVDAFWTSVMEGVVAKKYPEDALQETYDSLIKMLEEAYKGYSDHFTFDEFMCIVFEVDRAEEWEDAAWEQAKFELKKKLVPYHIMNVEGLKPSEEEYNAIFDKYLLAALEAEHIIPERYDDNAAYEAAKEKYKANIIAKKGENYFKTIIYEYIFTKAILSYANVVEITE